LYLKFVLLSIALESANRFFKFARLANRWRSTTTSLRSSALAGISRLPFWLFPVVLFALAFAFRRLIDHAYALEPAPLSFGDLPLMPLFDRDHQWSAAYGRVAPLVFADVCAQSLVLAALYLRVRSRRLTRLEHVLTAAMVVAFIALSFASRLLESADMYAYVANARLGLAGSYGEHITVDAALRPVTAMAWGPTFPRSPYGPLWQFYNEAIAHVPSLAEAVMRLRIFNAVVLVAFLGGLALARVPQAAIVIIALNPYVYQQFVVNAHNDLLPVAALILGAAIAPRSIWLTCIATVAAGLIKFPLCFVGLATLATVRSVRTRVTLAVAILASIAALSFLFGGEPYIATLLHASLRAESASRFHTAGHALVVVLTLGALVFFFATRQRWWPGLLGIPALGAYLFPWYLLWLVPLAFARRSYIAPIVVSFPIAGMVFSDVFSTTRYEKVIACGILALAAVAATERERRATRPFGVREALTTAGLRPV